jgi:nitrogen fixation protein
MRLTNRNTGDVLELPAPDQQGRANVTLNGRIIERVVYRDEDGGSVTLANGTTFSIPEWVGYLQAHLCGRDAGSTN